MSRLETPEIAKVSANVLATNSPAPLGKAPRKIRGHYCKVSDKRFFGLVKIVIDEHRAAATVAKLSGAINQIVGDRKRDDGTPYTPCSPQRAAQLCYTQKRDLTLRKTGLQTDVANSKLPPEHRSACQREMVLCDKLLAMIGSINTSTKPAGTASLTELIKAIDENATDMSEMSYAEKLAAMGIG